MVKFCYMNIICSLLTVRMQCYFLPGGLQGEGPYGPPLRKPTRTYAIGVKIAGGLEVVNSSTKMQFQVN